MSSANPRTLARVIQSLPTSDGAGVKLRRSLGAQHGLHVDPFLMLDEFFSDNPNDYLAGFPAHPHRGFETVTYMLDGHMRHEDHLGNRGDLGPGGVPVPARVAVDADHDVGLKFPRDLDPLP